MIDLNDYDSLDSQVKQINNLQNCVGYWYNVPFAIRKPKTIVERRMGKWVVHRMDDINSAWSAFDLGVHKDELEKLAQQHSQTVAVARRMDLLNARVREFLGNEDFEFYCQTLRDYATPRA